MTRDELIQTKSYWTALVREQLYNHTKVKESMVEDVAKQVVDNFFMLCIKELIELKNETKQD
jgi:hypothetical protein